MSQVVIVLAVFRPNPDYLSQQLASLARQTHASIQILAVNADRRSGDLIMQLAKVAGIKVKLHEPDDTLGAVAAFETGLQTALELFPNAQFFGFCDQDDVWHAERVARGLTALKRSGRGLVHSDARVVDATGNVLANSMFCAEQRMRRSTPRDLLRRNNVTGMTSLFTRDVAQKALPFPQQRGAHFYHDLWVGLIAAATSGTLHLKEPLVDYRQHVENTVGLALPEMRDRRDLRSRLKDLCGAYGLARYLGHAAAERTGRPAALGPYARRDDFGLRHLIDAAWHAATARPRAAKAALAHAGIAWGRLAWMLRDMVWQGPARARTAFDARLYGLAPGVPPDEAFAEASRPETRRSPATTAKAWWSYFDPRTRAKWRPRFSADTARVTILVPSLNPTEAFAGISTAIDIGLGLAARGFPIRFIATDLPIASHAATRGFLTSRLPLAADPKRVELACGVSAKSLPAHPEDHLLATAWWTAHVAQDLLGRSLFARERFTYLIQDYEPGFYPWGDEYAGALASYDLPFDAMVNSLPLYEHVLAQGHDLGSAIVFHPAIDTRRYADLVRSAPASRRHVTLYGRPEVARNMFHTSVEALGRAIEMLDLSPRDVRVSSVGMAHDDILLPNGVRVTSRGKVPWSDYPRFLADVDIGLALMLSPHPSHLPIEMAAAGARVVTNRFGGKDLGTLSPAILSVAPTVPELARALVTTWERPPLTQEQRQIDLSGLGLPLDDAIDALAHRLRPPETSTNSTEAA